VISDFSLRFQFQNSGYQFCFRFLLLPTIMVTDCFQSLTKQNKIIATGFRFVSVIDKYAWPVCVAMATPTLFNDPTMWKACRVLSRAAQEPTAIGHQQALVACDAFKDHCGPLQDVLLGFYKTWEVRFSITLSLFWISTAFVFLTVCLIQCSVSEPSGRFSTAVLSYYARCFFCV